MYLSLTATLLALGLVIALFFVARWRAGQPVRPEKGPRLIPWTMIAVACGAVGVILIAHLAELAGMDLSSRPRL